MLAVSAGVRWVDVGADAVPAERVGGRGGYEASSNQNSACGGSRAGANVPGVHGSPSGESTARAMAESTTTGTTLRRPPQGHNSTSVANTRRNSWAHGAPRPRARPSGSASRAGRQLGVARGHQRWRAKHPRSERVAPGRRDARRRSPGAMIHLPIRDRGSV